METIFVLLPLALLIAAIAVGFFIWAARTGQFDDLETPARPDSLRRRGATPPRRSRRRVRRSPGKTGRLQPSTVPQGGFPNEPKEKARPHCRAPVGGGRDGHPRVCAQQRAPGLCAPATHPLQAHAHGGRPGLADQREGRAGERRGVRHPLRLLPHHALQGSPLHRPVDGRLHELPFERGPEQGVGPEDEGLLGPRRTDPVGEGPRPARLRLLRPLGAREREGRRRATRCSR